MMEAKWFTYLLIISFMISGCSSEDSTSDLPECLQDIWIPPVSFILRSENYDTVQNCIENTNGIAKNTRFFAAAELVSGDLVGLGGLDALITPDCLLDDDAEDFLESLGQHLYVLNLQQASGLINNSNALTSPSNSTQSLSSSLEFDLLMVEFEQSLVEGYIQTQLSSGQINQETLDGINRLFDGVSTFCGYIDGAWFSSDAIIWARRALVEQIVFTTQDHREAIGKALVFQLHNCAITDYLSYMNNPVNTQFNEPTPPCLATNMRDLSGLWEGSASMIPAGTASLYSYSIDIMQNGVQVTGSATITQGNDFGQYSIEGEVIGNELILHEVAVVDSNLSSGYWCLKTTIYTLNLDQESMVGNWTSSNCSTYTGTINLQRR